jgi:protein-disulfide isomerase
MTSSVTLGIVAAYLVGKPIGVLLGAWVATWGRFGGMRPTITWPTVATAGVAAGAGFTVSLLVVSRAFEGQLADEAKVGILATAVLSPLLGRGALLLVGRISPDRRARQLGSRAEVLVDLADDVDLERDHVRGRVDAPVTLVQYGDFECPYCGAAAPVLRRLIDESDGQVRLVWRHFPLFTKHPYALTAALAAEASGDRFWAMHDQLLTHQSRLTDADLAGYAARIGVVGDVTGEAAQRFRPAVETDYRSGVEAGVRGTPTLFLDGRAYTGRVELRALRSALGLARAR